MSKINIKSGFIKKYWMYILIVATILIFAAISIDVWWSNGKVIPFQTSIFNTTGNIIKVQSYKFEYEHKFLKILSIFLYSFSMSLLIALFILKVIQKDDDKERELKDERRKEAIFKNVFKGVFDRLIPSEIFDVIKSDILEAKIVRKNVKWIYDFVIENGKLVLYRNVMYESHNVSSNKVDEKFSYIFSATEFTETNILFLKWHEMNDIKNTNVAFDVSKGENANKVEHDKQAGKFEQVTHQITIPCDKIININFKSQEIYKSSLDYLHETHVSSACSIGWDLQVNFPIEYEFSIISGFAPNLRITIDEPGRKGYSHSGAILKGQGVEFTLTKLS